MSAADIFGRMTMVANLLLVIGACTAMLSFVELLMDDKAKERLSLFTLGLWNKLDNIRRISFIAFLRNTRNRWTIVVLLTVLMLACDGYLFSIMFDRFADGLKAANTVGEWIEIVVAFSVFSSVVSAWFGNKLLVSTIELHDLRKILIRCVLVIAILAAVLTFNLLFSESIIKLHLPGRWEILIVVFEFALGLFGQVVVYMTVILFIPLLAINIAALFFAIAELIVRRIAEYPSGPIIGASVIVAGLGAVLKEFAK